MVRNHRLRLLAITGLAVSSVGLPSVFANTASAGNYVVAQCSPGLYEAAPDATYTASSAHYAPLAECGAGGPGLAIQHHLEPSETGTSQGAYGAWVFQAPAGTFITGGSVYSRLATEDGQHGYLAVSPDAGASSAFSTQSDNMGHETGIPAGNWRFLVLRLECSQPSENSRCVGAAGGALASVKQIRIALTDVSPPVLQAGGSLFSGLELRGPQTVEVVASDQGAGLQSIQISVNGTAAAGEDLTASCNPLPGALTSRLSPCPPSFAKSYTLETASAPFREGLNTITVCANDYAQTGTANTACQSHEVLVNNLCPASSVAGGSAITAGFGNGKRERTLAFHQRALIRGRVLDSAGQPVPGAQVCIQGHTHLPGLPYHLIGTTTTNPNGGWAYKLRHGPSRDIRVGYRYGAFETAGALLLEMRARATLHLNRHRVRVGKKVYFSGVIPGPAPSSRVVVIRGTVPGASRDFLVRRARTDAFGHYRIGFALSPIPQPARFEFEAVVPEQNSYPYRRGHSVKRYVHGYPARKRGTK